MRIGIVGAGAVAPLHARAAGLIPGTAMTAVCDLKGEAAHAVADPIGAEVFRDYRDLLAADVCDLLIVNTPHGLHHRMTLDAAAAHDFTARGRTIEALVDLDGDRVLNGLREALLRLPPG